jgi:hypothetical protein
MRNVWSLGNHTLASMYDYSGRHIWLRLKAAF